MRLTIICLLFALSSYGQTEVVKLLEKETLINNFEKAMALQNPSVLQIDSLIKLSYRYLFNNQDTCLLVAKKAAAWSEQKYPNQLIHGQTLLQLGDAYRVLGELDTADQLYDTANTIFQKLDDQHYIAKANTKLGASHTTRGHYETALNYHLKALATWENLKDTQNIFRPFINISEVFYYLKRLDKAQEYNLKALDIAEKKNYVGVKMLTLSNSGIFYKEKADDFKAIADTITMNTQAYRDSAQLFYTKALKRYEESLEVAKKGNNKRRMAEFMGNLVDLKISMGNFDSAITFGQQAAILAEEIGSKHLKLRNKAHLADAYQKTGRAKSAIQYGEAGLKLLDDNPLEKSMLNQTLYLAYKNLGQADKALANYEAFNAFRQENESTEKNKAIADIEAKYQNAQKEKQILEQKNNILELKTTNEKIEKQRNYFILGALFLSFLGFFYMQFNKIKKERNDKIAFAEALIFAQEEERKRIARDLHDGVGQSLLLIKKQTTTLPNIPSNVQQMVSEALEEVRTISRDLHPFQLEKFGLITAINDAIQKVQNSTDLFISKDIDQMNYTFSDKTQIHVFRIIQEALNNIIKHAHATSAKISIQSVNQSIVVTIQDNGTGFDPTQINKNNKNLGLKTMKERVLSIGGQMKIKRGSSNGTVLEFRIPQ